MSTTNVTIRMNETLKKDLQVLLNELGMDITTYFTLAAKQAIREQALPFKPQLIQQYPSCAYDLARQNTHYNAEGRAVISKDDEWLDEPEWDEYHKELNNKTK